MTESVGTTSNHPPNRGRAPLGDLTLIVRVPGHPAQVRTFTDAERADAQTYAASRGGTVEALG